MELQPTDPITIALAITVATSIVLFAYTKAYTALGGKGKSSTPTVREINIYPIKSCGEVNVESALVTPRGFQHDRVLQVVSKVESLWSYCTPRDKANEKLFHVRPKILDNQRLLELSSPHVQSLLSLDLETTPATSVVTTVMGDGKVLLADYGNEAAEWIEGATGIEKPRLVGIESDVFLRRVEVNPDQGEELPSASPIPTSLADEAPFLLTTQESLVDLNERLASGGKDAVDMRRFRPNIVIDGLQPWEEDSLKRIKIGAIEFNVWQRCGRCTMTTIDRDTLKRCGEPLKTLGSFRERKNGQRNFGMHMIPVLDSNAGSGDEMKISVGDEVEILEYDEERRAEWMRLFGEK